MDRNKLMKMIVILAAIVVIAGSISRLLHRDSLTLTDYANLHPTPLPEESASAAPSSSAADQSGAANQSGAADQPGSADQSGAAEGTAPEGSQSQTTKPAGDTPSAPSKAGGSEGDTLLPSGEKNPSLPSQDQEPDEIQQPIGAILNGDDMLEQRVSLTDDFYYEPLSDNLRRYITGVSYPEADEGEDSADPEISLDELRYVHILHIDYEGSPVPGELICNEYIAEDLVDIFYELYRNEYRLESVALIDEYDGDDNASMEANNSSCFNYRPVTNSKSLSMHAYGLAVDINPLYNPYVAFLKDGSQEILPASAQPYADRKESFPYKIDEDDLCYKLFTQHGFIWGGNWNNLKDYQHFQKSKP